MLIGVLAQVEAAVAPFVRPAEPEAGDGIDTAGPMAPTQHLKGAAGITAGVGVASQVGGTGQQDDLGVAISRDEVDDHDEDGVENIGGTSKPRRPSPPAPKQAPIKEKRPEKGEIKGKKRSRVEDAGSSSRIGKPEKPTRPASSKDEKKVKKKKKKKGGDEFDDLFSSLV